MLVIAKIVLYKGLEPDGFSLVHSQRERTLLIVVKTVKLLHFLHTI